MKHCNIEKPALEITHEFHDSLMNNRRTLHCEHIVKPRLFFGTESKTMQTIPTNPSSLHHYTRCILQRAVVIAIIIVNCHSNAIAIPAVVDNSSGITVSNSNVSFTIEKTGSRTGEMRTLLLDGVDLMSHGSSRGYFSAFRGEIGSGYSYWELGQGTTNITYTTGSDYVDVAVHHPAETSTPYDITQHYILRDGETGFHTYAEIHHPDELADYYIEELRYLIRADPTKFTHHWVSPTRHELMPTPSELGTSVQDATHEVPLGGAYNLATGREYYTKYDYSIGTDEVGVYGFYGTGSGSNPGYGMWLVQPNKESLLGGPTKQELTVHQTTSTPALIGMLVGQHYNQRVQLETPGEFSRDYGPFYVHLNSGNDPVAMHADAASYYNINQHQSFYDSLNIDGWVGTTDRSNVQGQLHFDSGQAAEGAYVILHDNESINDEDDFQFSRYGYQYWGRVEPDGSFDVSNVRPGTYRLSAFAPGTFGEYRHGEITVGTGTTLTMNPISWQLPDHGADLWQIGTFDRTAREFKRGANDEFRQYAMWEQYPNDFPNDVHFVIGQSEEAEDWNYMHWENVAGHGSPKFNIEFYLNDLPDDRIATLTIAVAGQTDSNLRVRVNGIIVESNWNLPFEGTVGYRSGMEAVYQSHEISFSSAYFLEGTNIITLEHASPEGTSIGSPLKDGIIYDALRLEMDLTPDITGDYDFSGNVDGNDYLALLRGFSSYYDSSDLGLWQSGFGNTTLAAIHVPEPSGYFFILIHLLLLERMLMR